MNRPQSPMLPPTMSGSSNLSNVRSGFVSPLKQISGAIYCKVIGVNWFNHTIDCVGMYNQAGAGPWYNVPIVGPMRTQSEGVHWLPTVMPATETGVQQTGWTDGDLDAVAVIDFISGDILKPICLGFVSAGPNEFSFGEEGTKLERHSSGVYSRLTQKGLFEFSFPDGTFLKIGPTNEGAELTDLSGQNVRDATSRPWSIPSDDARAVTFAHASGSTVNITELGDVSISSVSSTSITMTADGIISIISPSGSSFQINPDGSLAIVAGTNLSVSAPSGSIKINDVNLVTHYHPETHEHTGTTGQGGADNHTHPIYLYVETITGSPQ